MQLITEIQLKQLKKIELEMLKEFIRICETNNLKYFVVGGTLLGAIRHGGFIPWDDDIDVGMMREDYEKFLAIAPEQIKKPFFLQTFKTDEEYNLGYAKLRNSETSFVETSYAHLNMCHGVFIDIFVLDYYPENRLAQRLINIKKRLLYYVIEKKMLKITNKYKKFSSQVSSLVMNTIINTPYSAVCLIDSILKNVKKSKYVFNAFGAYGLKEIVPSAFFEEVEYCEFEGIKVAIPGRYNEYLTHIYGDYMKLPPEEKRIAHHYCDLIELGNLEE